MTTIAGCKRLIVWGGMGPQADPNHSHRWIWHSYSNTARKLGMEALWLPGTEDDRLALRPGDLIFGIDIWAASLAPAIKGARYCLHNFDGSHPLFASLESDQFIRLQVYTNAAAGERLGPCRYWLAENRTLTQPWGTDLLAEEFYDPAFSPHSREAVFVGAIWNTAGQGNTDAIGELTLALGEHGLKFVHKTQITEQDMIQSIRGARLAPAVAGEWQVANDYLPCRVFKNVSYGQLAVTNVGRFYDLFRGCSLEAADVPGLVTEAMSLRRGEWVDLVLAQQKVASGFTYRESLAAIDQVFNA